MMERMAMKNRPSFLIRRHFLQEFDTIHPSPSGGRYEVVLDPSRCSNV